MSLLEKRNQLIKEKELSAKEKLKELNEMSKQELENSLLKETLIEYMEVLGQLKEEQNNFLLRQERKSNEQEKRVRELEESNEILSKEIEKSLLGIKEDVKKEIMNLRCKAEDILKDMEEDINKSTEKLENKSDEVINKIENKASETLDNVKSFWKFNKLEKGVFWTFIVAFLIYFLHQTLNIFDLNLSSLILKIVYVIPVIFFIVFEIYYNKK